VAQSVNQVLSDLLVDPPEVLSAMRMCCQSAWLRTRAGLGGPLIKLFRLFGQLDGEEGLHAGVEVESFTGPAGSDGLGGWVMEAVHCSELIRCFLAAAQRVVEMPGQILIVDPPITGLPVGFGEHPTIGISCDGDTALMNRGVMPLTQQRLSRESAA
jgi:hypothetical protein